jgi:peptidoglycan/LPS O-acetylase OafA/YrhL
LVPVVGAGLIIVGGMSAGRWGVELLLGTFVFRWVGKLSYSLYLWSWPVLTIAEQETTKALTLGQRLLTVAASLVLAAATFTLVENPIRHSKWIARHWWKGVLVGLVIIGIVLLVATLEINTTHTL